MVVLSDRTFVEILTENIHFLHRLFERRPMFLRYLFGTLDVLFRDVAQLKE